MNESTLGPTAAPGSTAPASGDPVAVLTTNQGTIVLKFFPEVAPNHVANFRRLCEEGAYNGTRFHRVIPGFMIQGGDPKSKDGDRSVMGTGGPGWNVDAEFNEVSHTRGILSMARAQHPDSAGSQFFICVADVPQLDRQYTVFGQVVAGMDIVDRIVNLPRDARDNPHEDDKAVIERAEVVTWPLEG